jgi:hypothetical protein
MRRKRLLVALGVGAVLALLAGLLLALPRKSSLEVNYDRVPVGMAQVEAEAILGEPSSVLPGPSALTLEPSGVLQGPMSWDRMQLYEDWETGVIVRLEFDHDGRVTSKRLIYRHRRGWWQNLRDRLGW